MKPGQIVIATAGKEKLQKFVVVKVEDKFVYLANGKRLKASKPKKKSLIHIRLCKGEVVDLTEKELLEERVNAKIRNGLKRSKDV